MSDDESASHTHARGEISQGFSRPLIELSEQQEMHIWIWRGRSRRLATEERFISRARHAELHATLITWEMDQLEKSVWNTGESARR